MSKKSSPRLKFAVVKMNNVEIGIDVCYLWVH